MFSSYTRMLDMLARSISGIHEVLRLADARGTHDWKQNQL
jgi:hypothetical protein